MLRRSLTTVPEGRLVRLLALYACWGSSVPAMKVMVATVPPLGGAAAVFALGGGVLAALARRRPRPSPTRRQTARAALAGTVLLVGGQGLAMLVLTRLDAGLTAVLAATVPLWIAIGARVTGVPVTRATALRLLVGFGGIAIVVAAAPRGATDGSVLAVAGACLAPVFWACGSLLASRGDALPADPVIGGAIQLLAGAAALAVLAATVGQLAPSGWSGASPSSLAAAAFLLAFDSVAGFLLYTSLVRTEPLALVSTYSYVAPVVAAAIGVLALGEHLSAGAVVGGAVVLTAVAGELRAR